MWRMSNARVSACVCAALPLEAISYAKLMRALQHAHSPQRQRQHQSINNEI